MVVEVVHMVAVLGYRQAYLVHRGKRGEVEDMQ
jgi:hypothetical protein